MKEREYIEHTKWDLGSIIDVAIDTSVEVLRVEGSVGRETLRLVGQNFAKVKKTPFKPLSIVAPDGNTTLVTFIPPLEFGVNRYDLDEGEPVSEARLVVFNPLAESNAPAYRKNQMDAILEARLRAVSESYFLKRDDLQLTFPREFYALRTDFYTVPVLG